MKMQLFRKFATIYRPFLISLDQDLCALYTDTNSAIAKALNINDRRKYGNMYDPCPISVEYLSWALLYEISSFNTIECRVDDMKNDP